MSFSHTPVLLKETIEALVIKKDAWYIDATIGGGGHTEQILRAGGRVLGIDQDEDAIEHLKKKFESEIDSKQLVLVHGNFGKMDNYVQNLGIEIDGILLDLGVSSYQLDEARRGFSFRHEEELDMRMDKRTGLTAKDIVNTYTEDELYEIFMKYGEEPNAKKYAQKIVAARKIKPIHTTNNLAELVLQDGWNNTRIHPATRIFQALRIVVNDEIGNLKIGLDSGFKLLKGGGRFEIISFHSLEDRVVKLFFQRMEREGLGRVITKKPITARDEEVRLNKRSRSAKLRIMEKIT